MDKQLVQSPLWIQRLLILSVVLIVTLCISILGIYHNKNLDPYIHQVLSLEGDPINGEAIFQINCAGCHGIKADGSVGPSLQNVHKRKSKIELINQVISGNTPPMPKFQPSPEEMADLLTYLEQL
ncbi:MAG: cytochrome c [Xenococcaceae cyanobacterium MO_188.B19]|nr:cytochrome c [Xenococcaceae cyanobacterium MO_188.B19]MDJ0678308.1 cytochrome c [Xenococcaceae cyanobacterium MO_167.B52]